MQSFRGAVVTGQSSGTLNYTHLLTYLLVYLLTYFVPYLLTGSTSCSRSTCTGCCVCVVSPHNRHGFPWLRAVNSDLLGVLLDSYTRHWAVATDGGRRDRLSGIGNKTLVAMLPAHHRLNSDRSPGSVVIYTDHSTMTCLPRSTHWEYEGRSKSFEPGYLRIYFWIWNVKDFNCIVLSVFCKNFMSSACLFYEIQFIAFS